MQAETDMWLLQCPSYNAYKETFITKEDTYFLRNRDFSRLLVELGYRSNNAILTPDQFEKRKAAVKESLNPTKKLTVLFSEKLNITDPVLKEMARREMSNNQKIVATIIFFKYKTSENFTISGYIDFEESLRKADLRETGCIDWRAVFTGEKTVHPRPSDLSWYSWRHGVVRYNNSDNWKVLHDFDNGILFMHIGDHKICSTMPKAKYSNNFDSSMHFSEKYGYVHFFDHIIHKKA